MNGDGDANDNGDDSPSNYGAGEHDSIEHGKEGVSLCFAFCLAILRFLFVSSRFSFSSSSFRIVKSLSSGCSRGADVNAVGGANDNGKARASNCKAGEGDANDIREENGTGSEE